MGALGLKPWGTALFGLKCWGKLQIQALNWWSTHGFSYDDDAEELTRFANKVVRSQEDFTRWKTKTHKRLDRLILSVFFPNLPFSQLTHLKSWEFFNIMKEAHFIFHWQNFSFDSNTIQTISRSTPVHWDPKWEKDETTLNWNPSLSLSRTQQKHELNFSKHKSNRVPFMFYLVELCHLISNLSDRLNENFVAGKKKALGIWSPVQ